MRQDIAVLILGAVPRLARGQRHQVLPKCPLGETVGTRCCTERRWQVTPKDGLLQIDNNVAERKMKWVAIGRKNWLSVRSLQGGHTAAPLPQHRLHGSAPGGRAVGVPAERADMLAEHAGGPTGGVAAGSLAGCAREDNGSTGTTIQSAAHPSPPPES
jgi:hypothetical protein